MYVYCLILQLFIFIFIHRVFLEYVVNARGFGFSFQCKVHPPRWCVISCGSKNKYQKNMCSEKIALCAKKW